MIDVPGVTALLGLAFGLGMVHALDADHVMAVSGLASTRATFRDSLRFCGRWALGHGLTLLLIGSAVLLVGMSLPDRLSALAEQAVGGVLVLIGAWVLWDLLRRRAHVHFHRHSGYRPHAHWHTHHADHALSPERPHRHTAHGHQHGAVLVGVLHGAAGSAPLLALLPVAGQASPWLGMAYLMVFGMGVLLSMLLFGGLIGGLYGLLSRWGQGMVRGLRSVVGLSSMGFGLWLLLGAA